MLHLRRQNASAGRLQEWAWFFAPLVILLIPFVNFAKSNAYPLFAPELLMAVSGFAVAGILLGALTRLGRIIRSFVIAGAITLLVDVQTDLFEIWSLHQYGWVPLGLWLLIFLAPRGLETPFTVLVYAMFIVVLLTPSTPAIRSTETGTDFASSPQQPGRQKQYWIHIILDEQIGIESVPAEFDPNYAVSNKIRDDLIADGFTVYGRAYTRFSQTHLSLPNILNFAEEHPVRLVEEDGPEYMLKESRYLERLGDLGFDLHILDSTYFRICNGAWETMNITCDRYNGNTVWGLHGAPWPVANKAAVILRVYARLSKIYTKAIEFLDLDRRLSLPQSIAPLVAWKVAGVFEDRIPVIEPGSAWIVHLFLPHDPYAFDPRCAIRDLPWLDNGGHSGNYEMNTPAERQQMYPLYLEQMQCTHRLLQGLFDSIREAGIYDDAHIVVHGDHGSRIATVNLSARPAYSSDVVPAATLIDYHGTLFAYKAARQLTGEYRPEVLPVAVLLDKVSAGSNAAVGSDAMSPHVNLTEWDRACSPNSLIGIPGCRLLPVSLPDFHHDQPELARTKVDESVGTKVPATAQ